MLRPGQGSPDAQANVPPHGDGWCGRLPGGGSAPAAPRGLDQRRRTAWPVLGNKIISSWMSLLDLYRVPKTQMYALCSVSSPPLYFWYCRQGTAGSINFFSLSREMSDTATDIYGAVSSPSRKHFSIHQPTYLAYRIAAYSLLFRHECWRQTFFSFSDILWHIS